LLVIRKQPHAAPVTKSACPWHLLTSPLDIATPLLPAIGSYLELHRLQGKCCTCLVQRRKMQQSQSADGGTDAPGASSGSDSNVLKSFWKKAISKLTLRRSRSSDEPKSSTGTSNNAGTLACRLMGLLVTIAIRARYNILRGVMCFRAIMNMTILLRCCRML